MKKNTHHLYLVLAGLLGVLATLGLPACKRHEQLTPDSDPGIIPVDCFATPSPQGGKIIPGEYLVVYKSDSKALGTLPSGRLAAFSTQVLQRNGITAQSLKSTFTGFQRGFVCQLNLRQLKALQQDPDVELVEPDRIVSVAACLTVVDTNTIAWGTQRVGYGDGTGRTVWIIDSGIDTDHEDLAVDVIRSRCFIKDETSVEDVNGHGTHVAGVIGAKNNTIGSLGVAAGATVVALKVLNQIGEGRISAVVAALSYVNQQARRGDVVNMSLVSDTISQVLDREVTGIADKGILFAIASGNNGKPVSGVSPSRINHPNVFTVAAMDKGDIWANFSNFGSDIIDASAPGVTIVSTYLDNGYATMSGTSVATPHVAGLLLLDGRNFAVSGQVRNDPGGSPALIPHKR
jgi:subtilisin family serine protease